MVLCVLKAIGVWIILIFACNNLLGFIVRGLFWTSLKIDNTVSGDARGVIGREITRLKRVNCFLNIGGTIALVSYYYGLIHFGYAGLALASAILMVARIPDLLWELRIEILTGEKAATQKRPHGPVYVIAYIAIIGALALVWHSLCK